MTSRRVLPVCAIVLALLLAALPGHPSGAAAGSGLPALPDKKVCKTVTKKVHGKKKRVRVCHTVKPKPTATPTDTPTPTATPTPIPVTENTPAIQQLTTLPV